MAAHVCKSKAEGHGAESIFSRLTPTNQCINCGTTFQERRGATVHLTRAWHSGRCIKGNTAYDYKLQEPDQLDCIDCAMTFKTYKDLRRHLGTHLPFTSQGGPIAVHQASGALEPRRRSCRPEGPRRAAPQRLALPGQAEGADLQQLFLDT